jgi:hypothetical protein
MIKARGDRSLTTEEDESLSKYFLHYEDTTVSNIPPVGASQALVDNQNFYLVIFGELINYVNSSGGYDPFAVCAAIRIRVEKKIYNDLDPSDRPGFLRVRGTNNKLDYAAVKGIDSPEVFYLLGVLYNEALHAKEHQFKYLESKIEYQLNNSVIKNLIKEVEVITR